MTYLAGLEAETVIWVARHFHPAHLSAIRWLNEHTSDPFAFFAVTVRVVRIGDAPSPVAPLFEVVERPNEWNRQVQVANEDGGKGRVRQFRQDFWHAYVRRYPGDIQLNPNHKSSNVFHTIAGMTVSQFLGQKDIGIYMRTEDRDYSENQYQEVEMNRDALESRLDLHQMGKLGIGKVLKIDSTNRDNWPQMMEWLHERLMDFRRVIEQCSAAGEATPVE